MPPKNSSVFQTVKTEGAILPGELLQRIAEGDPDVGGLTPESYHLAKTERINEAATRAWNRMQGAWEAFRTAMDKLPDTDTGTSLTRERWLLILFQELGYGRLMTHRAFEIAGKSYPISHLWQFAPIHLVSFRQELDRRTPGVRGAARVSPHSLVQEFLNRSQEHLWGFVSNGLVLRILRDNVSLTRAAYVEFDLQAMMDGEAYSDFFLLYLLCHQSRVEVPDGKTPEHCWLEKWYNTAAQQGVRALDQLRKGVQEAIEALAGGFLARPGNGHLREKLRSGELSTQDYYHQVLRQVYRLLFLFVAEDRQLLFVPSAEPKSAEIYTKYYSTQHLRALAQKRRGSRHPDLFRSLRLIFEKLRTGCEELALPALGSFLFSAEATVDLNEADIANTDLLAAIRHLAFTVHANALLPINYRNLGPEELGSVYESLLEMHPEINIEAATFALNVAAGSERKTTGSYYTPTSLVNCLLDSALNPVLDEACKKENPEKALLDLRICDPACGSGHFLIAAAHRLAKRLASVRAGEEEPAPESINQALRDVIGRCIYGVDMNPLAVELCKVSLWIEALEPGKALTFLDHHIQCGNSLLGTTPALMKKGIPNEAFKPIEGDIKAVCSTLRQENKQERMGGRLLFGAPVWLKLGNLPQAFANLRFEDDSTLDARQTKEKHYFELVKSTPYENARLLADAWCAAFVAPKTNAHDIANTEGLFRQWEDTPHSMGPAEKELILKLRDQYQFFHWHLAFPDVFCIPADNEKPENKQTEWSGGFDVVLGNPPWERIKLQEKEFFAPRDPDIANAPNAAARRRKIAGLKDNNPELWRTFQNTKREAEGQSHLVRDSQRYPLCGRGDVNTYAIFAELKRSLLNRRGRVGCIVPSGIATDDTTKLFFNDLTASHSLQSLYIFENERKLFPEIDHRNKFALITMTGSDAPSTEADIAFGLYLVSDLSEDERHFTLTAEAIALLNPNTRTCPIFRSKKDAELTKAIYHRVPILIKEARDGQSEQNPWGIRFATMFHMANDSGLFRTCEQLQAESFTFEGNTFRKEDESYLPLYEAKMIWHFDHRFGTYEGQTKAQARQSKLPELSNKQHTDPCFLALPRYWVSSREVDKRCKEAGLGSSFLAFRDVTNAVVLRTGIFARTPQVAVGHKAPLIITSSTSEEESCLLSSLNSFAFDYCTRQSIGGVSLSYFILKQLPALKPGVFSADAPWCGEQPLSAWIHPRSLELLYTAWDLEPFSGDCGYDGPPFVWDKERRFLVRCELDAAYFHLYLGTEDEWQANGTPELLKYFPCPRDAVDYMMETFPIVKKRDEAKFGEHRTKRVILEIYDRMVQAIRTGQPYQTQLDPAPGAPTDAQGNFIAMAQWDPANWPPHIHPPRRIPVPTTPPEQVKLGRAVAYINLLLHTWGKPVVREALEAGLVFMLNDSIRQRVLRGVRPLGRTSSRSKGQIVSGMDSVLSNLQANGAINTSIKTGRMVITLGRKPVSVANAPVADVIKAQETIQVVQKLGESRTLPYYAGVIDVEYKLV